ncbi:hypothetical protein CDD80_2332 [Ophiocordyceps camponoti-rufipedis]|uniref:Uncharacterized protein n=1 Tax=Ophiocordyceps camponoti-rufipedis TaxID=2004952 RepID=A0A2C5YBP7_9HYPO|nr:hypothetical protein CDD80_2332 [Ophiocordyceps camponoti-rufipedis]
MTFGNDDKGVDPQRGSLNPPSSLPLQLPQAQTPNPQQGAQVAPQLQHPPGWPGYQYVQTALPASQQSLGNNSQHGYLAGPSSGSPVDNGYNLGESQYTVNTNALTTASSPPPAENDAVPAVDPALWQSYNPLQNPQSQSQQPGFSASAPPPVLGVGQEHAAQGHDDAADFNRLRHLLQDNQTLPEHQSQPYNQQQPQLGHQHLAHQQPQLQALHQPQQVYQQPQQVYQQPQQVYQQPQPVYQQVQQPVQQQFQQQVQQQVQQPIQPVQQQVQAVQQQFHPAQQALLQQDAGLEATGGETARAAYGGHVRISSAFCRHLAALPASRTVTQRKPDQPLNLARRSNVEALLGYVVGESAAPTCRNCVKGHGPWTQCVVLPGQLQGACTNCWFNASGSRWDKKLRQQQEQEAREAREAEQAQQAQDQQAHQAQDQQAHQAQDQQADQEQQQVDQQTQQKSPTPPSSSTSGRTPSRSPSRSPRINNNNNNRRIANDLIPGSDAHTRLTDAVLLTNAARLADATDRALRRGLNASPRPSVHRRLLARVEAAAEELGLRIAELEDFTRSPEGQRAIRNARREAAVAAATRRAQ